MVKYSFITFFLIKELLKVENASGKQSTVSLFRLHKLFNCVDKGGTGNGEKLL